MVLKLSMYTFLFLRDTLKQAFGKSHLSGPSRKYQNFLFAGCVINVSKDVFAFCKIKLMKAYVTKI